VGDPVNLLLDLLQGAGLSAAAGVRPFLPALVAGGLASADQGIDFDGTTFAFLEQPWWLVAMAALTLAAFLVRRRLESEPLRSAFTGLSIGLGALLCAGSVDDRHDVWWYALPIGLVCALLASLAVGGLLDRVRGRLDREAAGALPVYADGVALVLAVLSVLVPPVSVLALGFLVWLLLGGRRREGEKFAGLRVLR
jgi:hypothetical protein